jgi:serine protease AprX
MMRRPCVTRRWAAGSLGLLLLLSPALASSQQAPEADDEAIEASPAPPPPPTPPSPYRKLAPALVELGAQSGFASTEMVDVVVTLGAVGDTVEAKVEDTAVSITTGTLVKLPFQMMRVPVNALNNLAADGKVRYVSADSEVFGASQPARATARVPGSTVHLNTPNTAFKGTGVTVAIVDTGVAPHPDFYHLAGQFDFVNGAQAVPTANADPFGHGTHVAGMVGATGANSHNGKFQGVATQASVVALRVLDHEGRGNLSDVLRALDWIIQVGRTQHGIKVANLSLGKGVEEVQALDPLVQAVNAVWDAGVVVIVSAGNHGRDGHYTISSPGNSRKVITVGSITDHGTGSFFFDDYVSTFSSRGPTLFDHVMKPDLLAPGNKIMAPYAENALLGVLLPSDRVVCGSTCGWRYMKLSGTSMSAGLVSGAAARMLQKSPGLSPATVKARLMRSARKIWGDPTATGTGVLDVEAAMNATGTVSGQALSPLMHLSVPLNRVYVEDPSRLWGGSHWAAGSLWPDGSLWADLGLDGFLGSSGSLWPDSSLWADGNIWTNGFLWADNVSPASADDEDPAPEPEEEF